MLLFISSDFTTLWIYIRFSLVLEHGSNWPYKKNNNNKINDFIYLMNILCTLVYMSDNEGKSSVNLVVE